MTAGPLVLKRRTGAEGSEVCCEQNLLVAALEAALRGEQTFLSVAKALGEREPTNRSMLEGKRLQNRLIFEAFPSHSPPHRPTIHILPPSANPRSFASLSS